MTKHNSTRCLSCGKKIVPKGANFCYSCGAKTPYYKPIFESAIVANWDNTPDRPGPARPASVATKARPKVLMTEAIIFSGLGVGSLALWPYSSEASAGLAISLLIFATPKVLPSVSHSFVEVWHELKQGRPGPAQVEARPEVLRVEHVDEFGRPRLIAEFDSSIGLRELAWIGKKMGEGASFSRPQLCQAGCLSQGQFHTIKGDFLKYHYALPRDERAPNLGVILTERGKRLVKRCLSEYGEVFS